MSEGIYIFLIPACQALGLIISLRAAPSGHPPMDGRALKNLRQMGIPPELDGETPQNVAMIFYYLEHLRPDGFVHINPLYCCPGAVSSALLK